MSPVWSARADQILAVGQWLGSWGINNWALDRQNALAAIDAFELERIGVLGGEVYAVEPDRVFPNRDGWHCDHRSGETDAQFLARSLVVAKTYIRSYKVGDDDQIRFGIVPAKTE